MPRKIPTFRAVVPGSTGNRHRDYNRTGRDPALLKLYSGAPWRKFRAWFKAERVLCERCKAAGRAELGREVHHKRDPRDHPEGFLDPANVELLCSSCHSRETASAKDRP
jgi:5-methylcytosine-specific restriction endonuclease McrA